ncbi:unnamed protein product [Boreogadus saida]
MVYNCICAGCNNSSKTGHRVHAFPKDKATLRQWVQFVRVRRADFSIPSVTKNSKVCSAHFTEEDYDQGDVGMPVQIWHDTASRKRELAMMLTDASPCETTDSVNAATVEDPLPYSTCDTGTQCILKPLGRSHTVQVNLKPKMVSMGTQTFTPLTSPDPTDREDDLSVISDASWVPGDQMSEEDEEVLCEEPTPTCDPHQNGIDKFIVCQEELMALFAICPACCEKSDSRIVQQEGTFVKIEQVCACGYQRFWQNQPILHRNMPTCNLLLSGAIHFSGCLATQTLRMMTLFGLQCISASTFFRHQRRYTIPVIIQAWQNE